MDALIGPVSGVDPKLINKSIFFSFFSYSSSSSDHRLPRKPNPGDWLTGCAAAGGWAVWSSFGRRSRSRVSRLCGYACAGPGSLSWQTTWCSGDTCGAWTLCGSWQRESMTTVGFMWGKRYVYIYNYFDFVLWLIVNTGSNISQINK